MIYQKSILIVTKPSRALDSLRALLCTLPEIVIVDQVGDETMALRSISKNQPDLLLLVTNLPHEEEWLILDRLKSKPLPRSLVLTNTLTQKKRAERLGADHVLLSGFPTAELFESIQRLLY